MDWIKHIFAFNATETHVRAEHSVPINSSQFLRQLNLRHFDTLVPMETDLEADAAPVTMV